MSRQEFLKIIGFGSAAAGTGLATAKLLGTSAAGRWVQSQEQYGKFAVEQILDGSYPYEVNPAVLKPMRESMTVFSRNYWDPARIARPEVNEDLTADNLVKGKGIIPNQTRLDYALMAASWSIARADGFPAYEWQVAHSMVANYGLDKLGPWDPATLEMNWADATQAVKHAALFYGASLVGVALLNRLWIYADHFSPTDSQKSRALPQIWNAERFEKSTEGYFVPEKMNRVIALAFEEDFDALTNSPGRLASAATGNGYSRMAITSFSLAEFIRGLGFRAIPAGNNFGLSIPIAIDAGLGEVGRNGILITPKYGPRIRLAKVITDMPLLADVPIRFGVREFCETCKLCADHCPSASIPKTALTWAGNSISNNAGIRKWYINPESCYDYNGFSCSNCKRVCPFNKPNNSWLHRMIRLGIKTRIRPLGKMMVVLDQASNYGVQTQSGNFWKLKGENSITARESLGGV